MKDEYISKTPVWKFLYKSVIPLRYRVRFREYWEESLPRHALRIAKLIYSISTASILARFFTSKTIFFYPHLPASEHHTIFKICYLLGYKMTNDMTKKFDLAVSWEDITVKRIDKNFAQLQSNKKIVNIDCVDISKTQVHRK